MDKANISYQLLQQRVAAAFQSELGQQLDELYTTSDGRIFVHLEQASLHAMGKLGNTARLDDLSVAEWRRVTNKTQEQMPPQNLPENNG
jgi:hypothetical protein